MTQPTTSLEQAPPTAQPQTQPPGSTEPVEKKGYASALLAYRVIDNLGDIIARQVKKHLEGPTRLLLVSNSDQALGGMPLGEIRGQISLTERIFAERKEANERLLKSLAEEPSAEMTGAEVAGLISAIGGITGTLTDVVTLFRSNYTVTEQAVDVRDSAVLSSVAGSLAEAQCTVFIPGFCFSEDSKILSDLANLGPQAAHLQTQRDALTSLLPKPGENSASDTPAAALGRDQLVKIAVAVRDTDAALLSFSGFRTSWTTPPQGQTQTKLEKALIRESIEKLGITHLLWLGNLSSGGETTTRESLIEGNRIGFMGGAAISFVLADKNGKILDGNVYAQYGVTGGERKDYMGRGMTVRYTPEYRDREGSEDD